MKSKWQAMYDDACFALRTIEAARCNACAGFGWGNQFYGHAKNRDMTHDYICGVCNGDGFKPNLSLTDMVEEIR